MAARRMNLNAVTLALKGCMYEDLGQRRLIAQGACFPEACDCFRAFIFGIFGNPVVQRCPIDIVGGTGDGIVEREFVLTGLFGVGAGALFLLEDHDGPVLPRFVRGFLVLSRVPEVWRLARHHRSG
jgi:hypothetical protein